MRSQPARSEMSRPPKKQPRIVRWLLLCLLSWMATFVMFLVTTEGAITSHLLGGNTIAITRPAQVELSQGEPFGLVSEHSSNVHCRVSPDIGETRTLRASAPSNSFRLHNPTPPRTEYAWFTGRAGVQCNAPTMYLPPERFDHTADQVATVMLAVSSLLVLIVAVQGVRRFRHSTVSR